MITRLLGLTGLYLGEEEQLMKSAQDNPEGFFENLQFSSLNDDILNLLGGGWDYLPPHLPAEWTTLPILDSVRERAKPLAVKFSDHEPWGWKDPRNSITYPFWKSIIPDLKFIICLRNPLEVANSLGKRGSASLNFSFQLWLLYNNTLLRHLKPGEFIVTHYDRYFSDPMAELRRLLDFLNIAASAEDIETACSTISPALQHHRLTSEDIKRHPSPYREEVINVYEKLCLLSEAPVSKLEEIEVHTDQEFDETPVASLQFQQNQYLNSRVIDLETQVEKRDLEIRDLNRSIELLRNNLISLQKMVDDVYGSSSWRITVPWRFVGGILRKIFDRMFVAFYRARNWLPMPSRLKIWIQRRIVVKHPLMETEEVMKKFAARQAVFEELGKDEYSQKLSQTFSAQEASQPIVTIIIPVFNHLKYTVQCLLSIADLPDKTPYEIIVVDDLSTDGTQMVMEGCAGNIRYLRNEENLGFLRSCNKAVSEARGEYILLLNNDTYVLPGWLDAMVATFANFPQAGLVGSKLIYPDKTLQEAGGIIWEDGTGWNYGRGDDPDQPQYNYLREVDYCSGASIMMPKPIWDKIGGFDELFAPAYYEDTDLAFRVREAGYQVFYQPKSQLIHFEGITSGRDITQGVKQHQEVNRDRFVSRWRTALAAHGSSSYGRGDSSARRYAHGRILYIDATTPTPDQDSGSMDAFNYMKMFREMGYEVSFLPVTNLSYLSPYTSELQSIGVECQYFPYVQSVEDYIKDNGKQFDVVFISRFPVAKSFLSLARKANLGAKVIFNTVDLHFLREERQSQVAGKSMEAARRMEAQELDLMRKSDAAIVVSERELEIVNAKDPAINVTAIPIPRHIPGRDNGYELRKHIAFLGGYQHQPNVDAVHYFMSDIWPLVSPRLPGVKFIIAGSKMPSEFNRYKNADVVLRGFVDDLDGFLNECRLMVAPLRFGAGVKGKIVTSLGYGVPCVATPLAVEGMGLEPGRDILVGATPEEFAEHVIKLYTSPDLWLALSEQGLHTIKDIYSLQVVENRLSALLDALLGRHKTA